MAQVRKLRPINNRRGKPATAYTLPAGEYWIKASDGPELGIRLTVSFGPAGLGIQVDPFPGTPEVTIAAPDQPSSGALPVPQR